MSAPTVQSVSYDQSTYSPGQLITVTVTGQAGSQIETRNVVGTGQFTDTATGLTGSLTGALSITFPVEDTTTAAFTDTDGRAYALKSLSQTPAGLVTAVFTATA